MFFPCRVYIELSRHDNLGYEWPLVRCCHLVVYRVLLMAWIRGCWLWLYYHDDYCIYFNFDVDIGQHSACLCMFQFIGANILSGLIKMTKIMKAKNQLLVIVSLASLNPSALHV
jgi:hypothetical protein